MTFNVSRTDLLRVINAVSKVILKKNSIAILDKVLVAKKGEVFTITGSSQENTLTMPVGILVDSGNTFEQFCIDPALVSSFLTTLPEQPLRIDVDMQQHIAVIHYENGEVTIPVYDSNEYPQTPPIDKPIVSFDIPVDILLPAAKAAAACVGKSEIRPVMTAVALDVKQEGVVFVGTDGHVLYKYEYQHGVPFLTSGKPNTILIPAPIVPALSAPFAGIETVTITHDANRVCIENGDICFTIRDIEGQYPNYNQVFPSQSDYYAVFPLRHLVDVMRRVQLMASASSELVVFEKDNDGISLSSEDIDFGHKAKERLVVAEGEKMSVMPDKFRIGFKSSDFLKLLANVATDNARLEFTEPSRPVIIKEDGSSALSELLMPLLLND